MAYPWSALVLVGVIIVTLILFLVLYFSTPSRRNFSLKKKHAVVTGGSKGIGKELAFALISRGCNISIIARNEKDLKTACEDLQTAADQRAQHQKVRWYSLDLTKDFTEAPFDIQPITDFENQMRVNFLSAVYATRCVVAGMKWKRSGHISFVSSAAGQCAIYGYTAYAPTKFALRGFADALQMELFPYNINVSILYPPNTDTEGFKVVRNIVGFSAVIAVNSNVNSVFSKVSSTSTHFMRMTM
ncbi:hypothetical protein Y032_0152g2863 [Ancylostoma ceylanicum]|uniref:Oxidoreductase, short chain dehydrogenase/reductase family protein n=1 Tax=Ancylostoma ceylanicum TaxID=53326 RepID=A0A016T0P2_9BILA|nr:hypothetical protein Y032_0152g2863 [Ancylostoma ceylanicum]